MPLIAKDDRRFQPAPEGIHQAVCVDVVDLGIVESEFQGRRTSRHMVRIVFQIEARMENGRRYTVSRMFNCTLNEKGNLRPFLESWRGRKFGAEEIKNGFDLETLIGVNARIQVLHNERGYADIVSIQPIGKNDPRLEPEDYVRQQDRQQEDFDYAF